MDIKEYLNDLGYIVNIDSGSDDIEGLNKVADFFAPKFEEIGWIVEKYDLAPSSGTCLICKNREAEHYDLMLVGHLDTVFKHGEAALHPFKIENDKAYGLGTCDMKHGSLLIYYLMKELPSEINAKLNILVVLNPDEETGSKYSRTVYEKYARITDYAYIYEASGTDGARCVERKGATGIRIRFHGVAGHSGYVFTNGARSAISEMARWIVKFDSLQSKERNTTVNVGVVSGGTKVNVVADLAEMQVGIRYSRPDEIARIDDTLSELLKEADAHGIGIEILSKTTKAPLVLTEKSKAYIAHISEILKKHGIEYPYRLRGGLSDANIISACGPICIDGMGPSGDFCHSTDEYLDIDSVIPAFNYSNILIRDLADNK